MIRRILMYALAIAFGAGLLATVQAVTPPPDTGPEHPKSGAQPDFQKMMEMSMQMGAPGPEHERFKKAIGSWKTESKMWWGPGEPVVSTGASTVELIYGGRFMKELYRCNSEQMPFEGMAIGGYDKMKKKYVSTWIDNTSTAIMVMEGTYDPATKTTTMFGECSDPMTGKCTMKNVIREIDNDKQVVEMYRVMPGGQDMKVMEITYTRQ